MQIEVTGEAEKLLRDALASGRFASASEFIAAMARGATERQRAPHSQEMSDTIDLQLLADQQGVGPVKDFRELQASFCPQDEAADGFLEAIHEVTAASQPSIR